ncbi:hypothetical protein [Actinokineospora sp. NBRC 105648]|uniref:hypothetical protein n=1 Tax=Actinokineospora sp. NBRC 105648 TaxID=3032206 RepID=UPI0024A1FEBF|nr:hypothetical protein [Actinokineospora sp. NBRC 105648]GLZ38741.1 hypothetical protein Acsp05_23650 [Actinokineospora sp. NBRC 105648]
MEQVTDVIEVDLTGGTDDAKVVVRGSGPLDPTAHIASLRVDLGAFREFLVDIGVPSFAAEWTSVRFDLEAGDKVITQHLVHDRVLRISLGAALAKVVEARRTRAVRTESDAAAALARELSDAMIHLGGHLSGAPDADAELEKAQRRQGWLVAAGAAALLLVGYVVLATSNHWVSPFTYLSGLVAVVVVFQGARRAVPAATAARQVRTGKFAEVHERVPALVSEHYAEEGPFVTVSMTPFDTWPD